MSLRLSVVGGNVISNACNTNFIQGIYHIIETLESADEGGDENGGEEMRWHLYMQTCMLFSFALLFSFSPFNSNIRRLHLLHYNKLHQDKTQIQLALSCLASNIKAKQHSKTERMRDEEKEMATEERKSK